MKPVTHKLYFSTQNGMHFINPNHIIHCCADGNYTLFFLKSDEKFLFCHQLGKVEQMLPKSYFIRVHHSHIVNRNYVVKYCYDYGGCVVLSNRQTIPVARRRRKAVREWLKENRPVIQYK